MSSMGNQYKLENACVQMTFKISHIEAESEGSTQCLVENRAKDCKGSTLWLVKDVAKDCVEGGTTCLKYMDDTTKSCDRGGTICLK